MTSPVAPPAPVTGLETIDSNALARVCGGQLVLSNYPTNTIVYPVGGNRVAATAGSTIGVPIPPGK